MARGFFGNAFVRGVNGLALASMDLPVLAGLVRHGLVRIRCVGRRSGTTFEIPVAYRRVGDAIVIPVGVPDAKQWWRNFLGEGGPITFGAIRRPRPHGTRGGEPRRPWPYGRHGDPRRQLRHHTAKS